jgi:hypothetical protein
MTDAQLGELLAVVGMANETNKLVETLQVPVDEAFLAPAATKPPAKRRRPRRRAATP